MSKPKIEAMYISPELAEIIKQDPWITNLIEQQDVVIKGNNLVINVPVTRNINSPTKEHPFGFDHGWYGKWTNVEEELTNTVYNSQAKVYYVYSNVLFTNADSPMFVNSSNVWHYNTNVVWGVQIYDGTSPPPLKSYYLQSPFLVFVSLTCIFFGLVLKLIRKSTSSDIVTYDPTKH